MTKRLIALFLVLILIFALVGCGKEKRKIIQLTLSTEDSEAILAAAGIMLPDVEEVAAAGSTIDYYSWEDPFHNYAEDEIINTGYWTFKNKYGCEINWIECTYSMRFDGLANLILAGTSPDFYRAYPEMFPEKPIKGMFQPTDDYIDYNDPLWKGMSDYVYAYFSLNGRPYIIGTDTTPGPVCAYNRRVMDEWGFDDPAELYYNDEWTWDKFLSMCLEFNDPDEEKYALSGFSISYALMHSSGASVVQYDTETKRYYNNSDDVRLERAASLLYDISKNQLITPGANKGGIEGGGIKEGDTLFVIRHSYAFTGPVADIGNVWGDMAAGEVMFCPLPRDSEGDGTYCIESMCTGYCIVNGAENPEGVVLLAACERFKVLDPTVISIDIKQKKEIYLWNDEMLDMWDICYELSNSPETAMVNYEAGLGSKLSSAISDYEGIAFSSNASTWAQIKEANSEKLQYYIDDLNRQLDEFEGNL